MSLTSDQISIIENIPPEGALEYDAPDGTKMLFSEAQRDVVVNRMLYGKEAVSIDAQKTAIIMMGVPGAGKTLYADVMYRSLDEATRKTTALIAYNENGAEEFSESFQYALRRLPDDASVYDRLVVQQRFQKFTQACQNVALRGALRGEHNLIVDITAAGRGAEFMVTKTLDPLGYQSEICALHAPFETCKQRALSRLRPSDPIADLVEKRIGVLQWMGSHAQKVTAFSLHLNAENGAGLIPVFGQSTLFATGEKALLSRNDDALRAMRHIVETDIPVVAQYISKLPQGSNKAKLLDEHAQASQTAMDFLDNVAEMPFNPRIQEATRVRRSGLLPKLR